MAKKEKRVRIEKKKEGLHIAIKAYKEESKQKNLTVWLIAWTLCGLAIGSQVLIKPEGEEQEKLRVMILVFLAFWGYFEYMVIKVFRWRKSGEEQFLITEEEIQYGRTYSNRGFLKPYRKDLVNAVRSIDAEKGTFVTAFSNSYWVIGGERLAFTVNGKVIPFGLQLTDKEARSLTQSINKELGTGVD